MTITAVQSQIQLQSQLPALISFAKIFMVTRSASGDDGVYHVIQTGSDMHQPLQRMVLKSSENHISESLGNIFAQRLKFAVPDMRGLTGQTLNALKQSPEMQKCVTDFNFQIERWNKGLSCETHALEMEGKKPFNLSQAQHMLMMSYLDCFDLRSENTLQQITGHDQKVQFLQSLSKLFLFDIAIGNSDRFAFIMHRDLFPDMKQDDLWGNLGNILCSFDDNRLAVIDSITTLPQDHDEYCKSASRLIQRILSTGDDAIDNDTFAFMLKLDDMLGNQFFAGHSLEDKGMLAAIARDSLRTHLKDFQSLAMMPEIQKDNLIQEMQDKQFLRPDHAQDLQKFNDNYNFIMKVVQNAFINHN